MASAAEGIAIIGMAGRFPGADSVAAFWENIKAGEDSISHFSQNELQYPPRDTDADSYVCAKGMLNGIDLFDARFFGYLPREAEVMDPQHRVFLEICWEAMEHAGYDSTRYQGSVGVYGGCYMDTYVLNNLCSDEEFRRDLVESIQVGTLQTELGNDKDYLATRVAYKLGLRGPAMTLQTACSTSLVAIATACQSIEAYQCDMALAGGITIVLPQHKGYSYKEGGMLSPDGVCRPFDRRAAGTVFSNGAAVLMLKRAEDAIRDNDTIYGIIRGYATNNDGGEKISYTAPSVDGQADVISLALGMGGIDARSIGYVEAHGTATPLGDPIEVAGLTKAFTSFTNEKQFCALGSVKANLGHLDCASGAIGVIKTAMALHEKTLPALLHFEKPNLKINFEQTPFFINTEMRPWECDGPRRAGVSSFGVGGTNAHIVIEEAAEIATDSTSRDYELLVLSARSEAALTEQASRLAAHLESTDSACFADTAFTLQVGRREFNHRRIVVARDKATAIEALKGAVPPADAMKVAQSQPDIIFMFPGQGAQYPGMGRELYKSEPVYREIVDELAETLLECSDYGRDIRDFLLWSDQDRRGLSDTAAQLSQTVNAQPALYTVECALAALFRSWGISPAGVIGHSIGEFAGAVSAGVLTLQDGARLVAARGAYMQAQDPGRMLAVMEDSAKVQERLHDNVTLAAINAPGACVVSGPSQAVDDFARALEQDGVASISLKTSHAFHSSMMRGAHDDLIAKARELSFTPPAIDFYSTLTGENERGTDRLLHADYWGEQLMNPVLFYNALCNGAAREGDVLLIEVGPGQSLTALASRSVDCSSIPAMRPANNPESDQAHILTALGRIWLRGARPDWDQFTIGRRRRVPLPTYPFERKRFWVEPKDHGATVAPGSGTKRVNRETGEGDSADNDVIERQLDLITAQLALLKKG